MFPHPYSSLLDGFATVETPTRPTFLSPSALVSSAQKSAPDQCTFESRPFDLWRGSEYAFSPLKFQPSGFTSMPQRSFVPELTSFPSSRSQYGIHASRTAVDPMNNNIYLKRLHSNPMFSELQSLLAQECLHMQVPTNLMNTTWSTTTSTLSKPVDNINDVFPRHMKLQERFIQLRTQETYRHDGLRLESAYSAEVGQIEVARYQALCAAGTLEQSRMSANKHFDEKRLSLLQRYEHELESVILKKVVKPDNISAELTHPKSDQESMKHKGNVARQLQFSVETESKTHSKVPSPITINDTSSCASSPECLQIDLSQVSEEDDSSFKVTLTNLSDSGVCDETCSEPSISSIDILQQASELSGIVDTEEIPRMTEPSVTAGNHPDLHMIDITRHEVLYNAGRKLPESSYDVRLCTDETYVRSSEVNMSQSRKRKNDFAEDSGEEQNAKRQCNGSTTRVQGRQLNTEQSGVLTSWYNAHIHYPYPSDADVQQLSITTGLQPKQVKKWFANKRVRCYNTLSISGNQHPIKFKYKGKGKGDSGQNKAMYQQLNPAARKHLSDWYDAHAHNPYPTEEEKEMLAIQAGITPAQVKSWFANKRSRTNNTRRQVPNYFINKFPEYTDQVEMISITREISRKSKRQILDIADEYLCRF